MFHINTNSPVMYVGVCMCTCVFVSHLQYFPSDELMTRLTLNSKMDLVVLLAVGGAIPGKT